MTSFQVFCRPSLKQIAMCGWLVFRDLLLYFASWNEFKADVESKEKKPGKKVQNPKALEKFSIKSWRR